MDAENQIVVGDPQPDPTIPVLYDGPLLDLPQNAAVNADGTVTVTLEWPKTLKLQSAGVVTSTDYSSLTFRRLTGLEVRKVLAAKDSTEVAVATSSGLGLGRWRLLASILDAVDGADANAVVRALLGSHEPGKLPENAKETADGVTLTLATPATDEEGAPVTEIAFKRFTAAQRKPAQNAPDMLNWAVGIATGLTPRVAGELIDSMDGGDVVAVNHVVLFLFGSGRD